METTGILPSLSVSVEQTPKSILKNGVSEVVLTNADYITVKHLPGVPLKETVRAVKTLGERDLVSGSRIIPHIAARNISSKTELTRQVKNLVDLGVTSALLVGGNTPDSAKSQSTIVN